MRRFPVSAHGAELILFDRGQRISQVECDEVSRTSLAPMRQMSLVSDDRYVWMQSTKSRRRSKIKNVHMLHTLRRAHVCRSGTPPLRGKAHLDGMRSRLTFPHAILHFTHSASRMCADRTGRHCAAKHIWTGCDPVLHSRTRYFTSHTPPRACVPTGQAAIARQSTSGRDAIPSYIPARDTSLHTLRLAHVCRPDRPPLRGKAHLDGMRSRPTFPHAILHFTHSDSRMCADRAGRHCAAKHIWTGCDPVLHSRTRYFTSHTPPRACVPTGQAAIARQSTFGRDAIPSYIPARDTSLHTLRLAHVCRPDRPPLRGKAHLDGMRSRPTFPYAIFWSAEGNKSEARKPKSETNSKCEYPNVQNGHRHSAPSYHASNYLLLVIF